MFAISFDAALALLGAPKQSRRRQSAQKTVLQEIGARSGSPLKLMAGRYGPYVTDGTINASLPRGVAPESVTYEQALELLAARRDAAPMPSDVDEAAPCWRGGALGTSQRHLRGWS